MTRPPTPLPWTPCDWVIVAVLAIGVVATRLPFRGHLLFNWDAADFALALRHYDVTQFQPHPPGYPVYIGLAWLFSLALEDHNASLVAVSLLFSALAVGALYALGRAIGGRRIGLAAALLLAGSVTYWTYGGLALTYVSLAFFSSLAALWGYEALFLGRDRLLALSVLDALAGGFRAELLLFLAPLWLACLLAAPRRRARAAAALAVAIVLAWGLPMMLLSGGPVAYMTLLFNYSDQDVVRRYSVPARGFEGLWVNLRDTASYVFYALYAIAPLFLAAMVSGARSLWVGGSRLNGGEQRRDRSSDLSPTGRGNRAKALFLRLAAGRPRRAAPTAPCLLPTAYRLLAFGGLWVGPMILFYNLIHVGDPGYVFSFYPALLLFTARWLARLNVFPSQPRAATGGRPYGGTEEEAATEGWPCGQPGAKVGSRSPYEASPAPVGVEGEPLSLWERVRVRARGARWLVWALLVPVLLANTAIFLFHQRPLTAWGVRQADASLAARLAYVRERFAPGEAVLLASDNVRHLRYYLPEYREYWVDRLSPFQRRAPLPEGTRAVVLFDADLLPLATGAEAVDLGPARVGLLPSHAGEEVVYGQKGIRVE